MYIVTYARSSNLSRDLTSQRERLNQSLSPEDTIVGNYGDRSNAMENARLPGLQAALSELVAGRAEAVAVQSLDRLARSNEELASLLRWLRYRGLLVLEAFEPTAEAE